MNHLNLLNTAQKCLEENAFADAVQMFRKYIHNTSDPDNRVLANLAVAEDQERIQFLRELVSMQNDNLTCRLAEISELTRFGYGAQAIAKCSAALTEFSKDRDVFLLKLARLRAACTSACFEFFVADFCDTWRSATRAADRFRPRLIEDVVRIGSPDAVRPLQELQAEPWVPENLKRLLRTKIVELQLLSGSATVWGRETE